MSFQVKNEKARAELQASKIWQSNALPPIYRLMRGLGFEAKPPHYASFISNMMISTIWFGVIWGALMWLMTWGPEGQDLQQILLQWIASAVSFGLAMAVYYRYSAMKNKLTPWADL